MELPVTCLEAVKGDEVGSILLRGDFHAQARIPAIEPARYPINF
jgi:hypothetical protein